jgi:hypothetical protein
MSLQAQRGSMRTLILGIVIAAPLLVAAIWTYFETPTSRYESYAEAQEAGAMQEGEWIPSFLPKSSRNIVEAHNRDTKKQLVTFDYTPGDLGALETDCERLYSKLSFSCDAWRHGARVSLDEKRGKGTLGVPGVVMPNTSLERTRDR